MSNPSSALYITFYPTLHASPVLLPSNSVFVCANSLVVADKAVGAKRGYNLRVVETLVGARVLAKFLNVHVGEREKITLREVVGRLAGEKQGEEMSPAALLDILTRMDQEVEVLKPQRRSGADEELGVTLQEMIELSGLPEDIFHEVYLSWVEGENTTSNPMLSNDSTKCPTFSLTKY